MITTRQYGLSAAIGSASTISLSSIRREFPFMDGSTALILDDYLDALDGANLLVTGRRSTW